MIKKLIVGFVAAFVTITIVVAVLDARQTKQFRQSQASRTPNLNTAPTHFP